MVDASPQEEADARPLVHLLDYGAGNVRSVRNAIERAGFRVEDVRSAAQLALPPGAAGAVRVLVFPGVGAFGAAVDFLDDGRGFRAALLDFVASGRPLMGVCLGMQLLFEASDEAPGRAGLSLIRGRVGRFAPSAAYSVPHMGWNGLQLHGCGAASSLPSAAAPRPGRDAGAPAALAALASEGARVYFVHSFRAVPTAANAAWVLATTDYGDGRFVCAVQRANVFATQFHPEKSGEVGLRVFSAFLQHACAQTAPSAPALGLGPAGAGGGEEGAEDGEAALALIVSSRVPPTHVCRRIIACLDVRANDAGDLVVTKGDQYDVRERDPSSPAAAPSTGGAATATAAASSGGGVRNLGKPVELCQRYYADGADEVCFLNITAFRELSLEDAPMLAVLRAASSSVFVPLTVGGGIRAYTDDAGRSYSALEVAARYFRAGADKVSIGSDAVLAAEAFIAAGRVCDGSTAIEQIARVYGRQAVVVSIDPRRVYVAAAGGDAECAARGHVVVPAPRPGPGGERFCWYQCTVRGGREGRPLCAARLAEAAEALGAGELLVNCVDNDGQKEGFDEALLGAVCAHVSVPVVASSGAGCPAHFESVFRHTRVEAALAAGIFHRREVSIADVKAHLRACGIEARVA